MTGVTVEQLLRLEAKAAEIRGTDDEVVLFRVECGPHAGQFLAVSCDAGRCRESMQVERMTFGVVEVFYVGTTHLGLLARHLLDDGLRLIVTKE